MSIDGEKNNFLFKPFITLIIFVQKIIAKTK